MTAKSYDHSPRYWRARAEEVRTIAEEMTDPWCRSKLESVADTYDAMAQRAEWSENPDRQAVSTAR